MPPRITLNAPRSIVVSRKRAIRIAEETGAAGVDLPLRDRLGRIDDGLLRHAEALGNQITSISVAAPDLTALIERMSETRYAGVPGRCLIVCLPADHDGRSDHAAAVAAAALGKRFPRLVLSVPTVVNVDGRSHLARIRGLKRLAEEWNFSLGIELDRRADSRWEAEAVVHVAAERLAFVRISTSVTDPADPRSVLVNRVLRAFVDIEFEGTVSISPDLGPWQAMRPGSYSSTFLRHRDMIRQAFVGRAMPLRLAHDRSVRQL